MESSENITKNKAKSRGKKRKRRTSDNSSDYEELLPDNALATENNLHASAIKNNLDEISVRKILKKVVTNDHVLALVKLREEEEGSGPEDNHLQPKLTRAKVKELMKVSSKTAAWNLENLELTPIKHIPVKTRPEVKALIAQELPDDEDDEEYEPTHEDVLSDDDQGLESCSDLESQPHTPATPSSQHATSPKVVKDGPFKVPQVTTPTRRKLDLGEEATIALRTRSKLSLSSTSIEHIESTFVPPDELPVQDVDDLWEKFLNECLNPASTSKNEDDDETDPEYNVAADPDANDEDEEALGNSIIKISKKELNDLVTELFNIMPETAADEELLADNLANSVLTEHSQAEISTQWEGKQEPVSDEERRVSFSDRITFEKRGYTRLSIGKSEPADIEQQEVEESSNNKSKEVNVSQPEKISRTLDIAIEEQDVGHSSAHIQRAPPLLRRHLKRAKPQCVTIQVDDGIRILPEQILILQQQLRQHIQLATSNFLQLYIHPMHWTMASTFKEYLETLSKLGRENQKSVVNVCNLGPAVELVETWEKTMSANTEENKEIVEFILNQAERCRRRFNNKSLYIGEFHETLLKTVANSPVFLYPYLLPPMPYRAEPTKRYAYIRSEDELIAIGLDQFWDYVEKNPAIYKRRSASNPRQRWGLGVTVQLVVKHMFPWIPYKVLLGHIQFIRKNTTDKDNPIYKFFENRTITPVKHKLLPFNPKLSLYEQPEHEVPKIWVRYLAKTSKRFRNFLLRRTTTTGIIPQGLEVELGQSVKEPTKAPLPIDFTKEIVSNRINVLPKLPQPILADKYDIQIATTTTPIALYQLVETNTGAFLMPFSNVTTVNTNTAPICTPAEVPTQIIENNLPESSKSIETYTNLGNKEHCSCCVLLRKICKLRQSHITDYFSLNKSSKCYCKDIKYPKISNRLRILISNYKNNSINSLELLNAKLKKQTKDNKNIIENETDSIVFDLDDFIFVTSFHLKLLTRTTVARDSLIKRRVYTILSRFNPDKQDPIELTKKLCEAFKVELVDIYKEFLCFLTPEQADKCDVFRDYFVRNCIQDLVQKVQAQVSDKEDTMKILRKLRSIFYNNLLTACEICTEILSTVMKYPKLAEYVFSLFPHIKQNESESQRSPDKRVHSEKTQSTIDTAPDDTSREPSQVLMDCEADHTSSKEGCNKETRLSGDEDNLVIVKNEIMTSDNDGDPINISIMISDIHDDSDSSSTSMTIVVDENVKPETADWNREEDKFILEILKEHLTPEERNDKTIMEIIDEKNIIDVIAENLTHKSKSDVTNRVLYLLKFLVISEK